MTPRKTAEQKMIRGFYDYQQATERTAKYPTGSTIEYLALGLGSEAGEAQGKIKKILRDRQDILLIGNGSLREDYPTLAYEIADELGDVLWYLTRLGIEVGFSLNEIANMNVGKLLDRLDRGVISGSGDNR